MQLKTDRGKPMGKERFWTKERREELDGMAPRQRLSVTYPKALPQGEGPVRERLQERIKAQWTRFAGIIETRGFSELRAVRDHLAEQVAREERRKEKREDQHGGEGLLASKSLGKEWKDAKQEWHRIKADWDKHPAAAAEYADMAFWRQTHGTLQELRFLLSIAENVAWRYAVYGDDEAISIHEAKDLAEEAASEYRQGQADDICLALYAYWTENNKTFPDSECGEPFNGSLYQLYDWSTDFVMPGSEKAGYDILSETGLLPPSNLGGSKLERLHECLDNMIERAKDIQPDS